MKDIAIIGAGGCAREALFLIERINQITPTYNIRGFIDEQLDMGTMINGYPVIGNNDFLLHYPHPLNVAIAIGSGKVRERLYHLFQANPNLSFPNLIDPSVICSDHVSFGIGTIISAGSILMVNIQLGDFVTVNIDCSISHDCVIESFATLSPNTHVCGNVHLSPQCYLGASSTIIQGKCIGTNTTIGAGATVVTDIPDNCTAVGIPARPVKFKN